MIKVRHADTVATPRSPSPAAHTVDRGLLRLSAALLLVGELVTLVAGILHPARETANDHAAAFAEYASSTSWTAVHLGQFLGMALIIAGLLVLLSALSLLLGPPAWAGRLASASAAVALALYGALQAVDGVALKQAVDAWAAAPDAERTARFASAEAIRWLEWGMRSYQSFVFGLTLVVVAGLIVWTARTARPVGYLMALSGLAYIAQGWVLGSEGFSATNSLPTLLGYVLILAWSAWLLVIALRMRNPSEMEEIGG